VEVPTGQQFLKGETNSRYGRGGSRDFSRGGGGVPPLRLVFKRGFYYYFFVF
jgi:hypothetical protein